MIVRFNRRQTLRAILALVLSVLSLGLAFLFFRFALGSISRSFDLDWEGRTVVVGSILIVLLIFIGGLFSYSRSYGHSELTESDLLLDSLDSSTGGSHFVGHYARRITGPAYFLSQLFLAGPLQMGKAVSCLRSRIAVSRDLETDLVSTLAFAREKAMWHGVAEYSGREKYLSYLIRMGFVEYSSRKGRVRFIERDCV